MMRSFAQNEAYYGGIADGHATNILSNFNQYASINMFAPFFSAAADGHATDSLMSFPQSGYTLMFSPYRGSAADGHATDSVISFAQNASINMFAPFLNSIADGYSADSAISFNQHGYINMFQPYASGQADGWAGSTVFGLIIVPVNLISFSGERAGKENVLYWTTSHEENTARFELERSPDGVHFTRIGTVPATGNSSTEKHYQYNDTDPMQGNNYYRLKIFDADGTFKYSNIILLKVSGNSSLSVYPNPTTKTLNVHISGIDDQTNVSASIFDATGKYVLGMNTKQVNATFRFDVERLPAGVYVLRIMWNNETSVWRFIKE